MNERLRNLTVLFVIAAFTLGCGLFDRFTNTGTGNSANTSSTSTGTSAGSDAAPPSGDPRQDVITASKKFLDLPQFSAKMDGQGTKEIHMTLDYIAPNRFRMSNTGRGQEMEMIMIGSDMYMKMGGRWQKLPGAAGNIPNLRQYFDEEGLKSLKDVKYVGDETYEGQMAHVYSYRNAQTNANVPFPFTSKIWVGSADGLPHKIEVTYEGGELKTMTIVYDFEKNLSIEPPAVQ